VEKLTFEYVLLGDVNDSEEDARRVVRLLSKLNCKVNLIALNPDRGFRSRLLRRRRWRTSRQSCESRFLVSYANPGAAIFSRRAAS
jgi:23S rRNA (adenine2503-C2)-methyltransferase